MCFEIVGFEMSCGLFECDMSLFIDLQMTKGLGFRLDNSLTQIVSERIDSMVPFQLAATYACTSLFLCQCVFLPVIS